VLRRIRPEAPRRLLELPLAADAVATAGLVPGDGDVDEPLEEVALLVLGGPPGVLELLVGREELAPADQIEAGGELVRLRP
jgi:hypothetical protein